MKKYFINFKKLEDTKTRSAWERGVKEYAEELAEGFEAGFNTRNDIFGDLLGGAQNWKQYSWGGCALIYNEDIAERLCSPSEFKSRRGGEWKPNRHEEWLDVQARALAQAAILISRCCEEADVIDII